MSPRSSRGAERTGEEIRGRRGWERHRNFNYLIERDPLGLVVAFFPPGNVLAQSVVVHDGRLKAEFEAL